jgi:hypothetical protein
MTHAMAIATASAPINAGIVFQGCVRSTGSAGSMMRLFKTVLVADEPKVNLLCQRTLAACHP